MNTHTSHKFPPNKMQKKKLDVLLRLLGGEDKRKRKMLQCIGTSKIRNPAFLFQISGNFLGNQTEWKCRSKVTLTDRVVGKGMGEIEGTMCVSSAPTFPVVADSALAVPTVSIFVWIYFIYLMLFSHFL
jgi:hypothetical protein